MKQFFGSVRAQIEHVNLRAVLGDEPAARALVIAFFVALFFAHATLLRPVVQNGDSAAYNTQIDALDLASRSTHVGYLGLGIVFNKLLPFGTDLNMNVMVLAIGVVGLIGVYAVARRLSGSRWAAVFSVLLALVLPSELRGSLLSEVDVVSVSLIALSYAWFLAEVPLVAGAVFGLSVLVTPMSGPMLTVFVLTVSLSEAGLARNASRHLLKLAKFGVAALAVYLPVVLTHYHDYVYGRRGLLNAPRLPLSLARQLAHSAVFIRDEAGITILFYALGVCACLASRRLWRFGQPVPALLLSVLLMAIVGDRVGPVPVQLPNLVLLAALPSVALVASPWALRLGSLLVFAGCLSKGLASYPRILSEIAQQDRDRSLCVEIRDQSRPRAPVLVGIIGWDRQRAYERYASSGTQSAKVLEWGAFLHRERQWLESTDDQIWFFRHVNERQIHRLLSVYSLESRHVVGRVFQVLVPSPK
ncbi:MAG: hypothetical protein WDO69_10515 [Pseudomonadota bacterium]